METTTKVCTKCKVDKSFDEFGLHKSRKDGRQDNCKQCIKKYRQENSEARKVYYKKWTQNNYNKKKEYNEKWRRENVEIIKKWRQENPKYHIEYQKNRRQSDPIFRMINNIRVRIRSYCQAIKANKSIRTKEMLGLDLAGFKSHIESKFQEGMTWENYGQWHVDHIKPISLARNEQEIIELNHYTNLQPLWASENIKKSNKYEEASHGNYGESFL